MKVMEINLNNLYYNIKNIINSNDYKYYMAVVKAECYGLGNKCIDTIIKAGCNYLVVSSLEEAIKIRKNYYEIPILILQPINYKQVKTYHKYNLTATIENIETIQKIKDYNLKIHLKIDTGMNRFGFKTIDKFKETIDYISKTNLILEGVYTHLYCVDDKDLTNKQINEFKNYIDSIDKKIPIIHLYNSQATSECIHIKWQTGIRLGAILYGISSNKNLNLKSCFCLKTKIINIKKIKKGDSVGYDGKYIATNDTYIAIIPFGYADGLSKNNSGRYVYIKNKPYKIVGNICMNCCFIEIDKTIKLNDTVYLYKDIDHVIEVSNYRNSVPEENMTLIKNVKREYKKVTKS